MQSKTPLLMVTALVCGLGAAFGTWKLVSGAQAAPVEDTMVKVLVPVADIPSYHLFQDKAKFTEKDWPKSKLRENPEDTITAFDQIKNKTSRHYKLRANEPVYRNDICDSMDNDIAERLKPGEVAEGIPVTAEDGGGFILVGDRVDIAATVQATAGEPTKTMYILEAIEVLAVDNQAQKTEAAGGQVTPPNRYFLRVTRQQALVLSFFRDTAKLKVFKRRNDDPQILGESWVFTMGKKPTSAARYQQENDDPIQTAPLALSETKLSEPTDSETRVPVAIKNTAPGQTGPEYDKVTSMRQHEVKLDDGQQRTIKTKDIIQTDRMVERPKKDEGKKDEKADEKKNNTGN